MREMVYVFHVITLCKTLLNYFNCTNNIDHIIWFYFKEVKNLQGKMFHKSQNHHLRLKNGCHKDAYTWLDHWTIKDKMIL